jgi:serine/threonine protein kinase
MLLRRGERMDTIRICQKCGDASPADAPKGLCPACLLKADQAADTHCAPEFDPPMSAFRCFGDYELLEKIAQGGMGVVCKARQVTLNRMVAVKMILAGEFASQMDVQRFLIEAGAAAKLQHPNIVAIHEVGEAQGQHYFSMDYVEGGDLTNFIKDQSPSAAKAAQLTKTIAEAIHYAHQRGVLHRDLKPHNVLMDDEGRPHVTDFGLAKRLDQGGGLTQTGDVMGSPSYMPPEQATGDKALIGPASDVYAIGAILYFLLTGHAPFTGESPIAILRKVVDEELVVPSKLNAKTPADLETICLKCLEKKPERRYATAGALAEELGRFLQHEPILSRPPSAWRTARSWVWRHPWIITVAATALMLGLVGFAYYLWQQSAFLTWKLTHPRQDSPYPAGWFESFIMLVLVAAIAPLSYIPLVDLKVRRRRGNPIVRRHLAVYAVIGSLEVGLGILLVLKWAEAAAWGWHNDAVWYASPEDSLLVAFVYSAVGMLAIWEAAREHFSVVSGLTSGVPSKPGIAPGWKAAPMELMRDLAATLGVPHIELKIGPATIREETVGWGLTLSLLGGTWLYLHGWWQGLAVFYGTTLILAMAVCALAQGAPRIFWLAVSVVCAGSALWSPETWYHRLQFFEIWILGVAGGLGLVKAAQILPAEKPGRTDSGETPFFNGAWFGGLRLLGVGASFSMFFALGVSHQWFFPVAGLGCLVAAAWCLFARPMRPGPGIIVVLTVLLISGIAFASPYGFLRSGRLWDLAAKSPEERRSIAEVTSQVFSYCTEGNDSRPMSFFPDGRIGQGAGNLEVYWDIANDSGGLYLQIFDRHELTCVLKQQDDKTWKGHWTHYEKMPVELAALPTKPSQPSNPRH